MNGVDEVGLRRDQVEITKTERLPEIRHLKRLVQFYSEEGFQVAHDDVGFGDCSLNVSAALRPNYVNDIKLIRDVDRSPHFQGRTPSISSRPVNKEQPACNLKPQPTVEERTANCV